MMHYLLFYEVDKDYVSKRAQFRNEHLKKAWEASERGELVLGGALANPVDGAVLLFKGDSPEVAERFAKADPYVTSGAVKRWYVREWTTVAGPDAATPVHSESATKPVERQKVLDRGSASKSSAPPGAILRMWRGRSSVERANEYVRHATTTVFPKLEKIQGNRGAFLLEHPIGTGVEFVVLTLWDSMEAVQEFAGPDSEQAVVEPEAKAVLSGFDDFVTHYNLIRAICKSQ
jgi:uncharacterized protein YciI/heme-degrading monooxygenase HmoA